MQQSTEVLEFLTVQEMDERFPDEWLLLVDCEVTENTELKGGKVVLHSKDRGEIHKRLGEYSGRCGIHFTGDVPNDLEIIF